MNTRANMIIIKGAIKTPEIFSCTYNTLTKRVDVQFRNGKIYSYHPSNVLWLKNPRSLNPKIYRAKKRGRDLYHIKEIWEFHHGLKVYWHIIFNDGKERDYSKQELEIVKSCLDHKNVVSVLSYLKIIAGFSDISNKNTGEKLLLKQYEQLSFVGDDVALAKYLNPSLFQTGTNTQEYIPIFPFGCNNSQYNAVKNALENQISVIQGPPGTGKTQTILNIIANILIQGKTVQIVSNSNSAIENVFERLSSPKYNLGFIAAMLGKSENKHAFIEKQNLHYPDFSSWRLDVDFTEQLQKVLGKSSVLKKYFDMQESLAALKQELSCLLVELKHFNEYVNESDVDIQSKLINKKTSSKHLMMLWQECQQISESGKKIDFLFKLNWFQSQGQNDDRE